MKKLALSITVIALLALSCSNGSASSMENPVQNSTVVATAAVDQAAGDLISVTGEPVHLTKQDFLEKVMNYEKNPTEWIYEGDLPAIIDFYADWCGPCRKAAPILEELAKEYEGKIYVYKIDTDKEKELASVFGIQSIPAFLLVPQSGKPIMTGGIQQTDEETKAMFKQYIEEILLKKDS